MVISGINNGANLGHDVIYSGTIAAAREAFLMDIPSIAISLDGKLEKNYESACKLLDMIFPKIIESLRLNRNLFLNINIPDIKFSKIKGTEITKLGSRGASNSAIKTTSPNSNISQNYYWIGSAGKPKDFSKGTDFNAIMNDKISITPLKIDQTDYDSISFFKKLVE